MKQILFLCTGNYYRSRFAEIYFNHHAPARAPQWRADSRALARDLGATGNRGPISRFALAGFARHGIPTPAQPRRPICAELEDLDHAHRILALSCREHAPMVRAHFPSAVERVEYLEIGDIDIEQPERALARLVVSLDDLIGSLSGSETP